MSAMTMKRCALSAAAILILAGGGAGCAKKVAESAKDQARTVSVVSVEPREIQGGLVASGSLIPREELAVFPQLTGYRVAKVLVQDGEWVKAGQPLVQLDDVLLKSQLAQQTALAEQKKDLAQQAQAQATRVKGLDNEGLLSQEQIDSRRFAAKSAAAEAAAAEAAAADIRTREALTTVRAPFDGLIIERTVRDGDLSGGTTPWYRIAKDGQIELMADVSEAAIGKIKPGAKAKVTLADGADVIGTVRLVSAGIDPATRLGRVRVLLPVQSNVRAGGFAKATFTGLTRSASAVPETAVRYDADGASVMVVGADGHVARAPVTTGQRGGGFVELVTGPAIGSKVVEKASAMLVPGDFVRTAPAAG
jgi:HlyD family secretion protein